jgi:hypothetical protein
LQEHYDKWDLALDDLLNADVLEIVNDDKFFLFEEEVQKVCSLFFRDKYIIENMRVSLVDLGSTSCSNHRNYRRG